MGAILNFFGRGAKKNNQQSVMNKPHGAMAPDTALRPENLKPLDSTQLLQHLSLNELISDIRRLVPVSDSYWNQLYYQAYLNTATIMQQLPASQAHHHAGPGGLLIHTTEVIRHSMRIVKNYQLPKGVGPEERTKREHRWRYGVFIAALLHDVGKTLAMCQVTLHFKNGNEKAWSPYLGQMPKNTDYYSLQFSQSKFYKLQQHLSVTLFNLIPETARDWLLQDRQLMNEIVAYLNGDLYECGVIGEIVRQADMESTSLNLRLGGHSLRFPGAMKLPLIDRLMTALRHLLNDGTLKINQKGSTGWTKEGNIYLVCRTVASAVQQYLSDHGATDIPKELTRLYDTWQEHGFALGNSSGGAIWEVAIKGENYQHTLTVLVFETDRLFKVGHRPKDFEGDIEILQQDLSNKKTAPKSNIQQKTETGSQSPETATEQKRVLPKTSHGHVSTENSHTETASEINSPASTITTELSESQKKSNSQNTATELKMTETVTIGNTILPGFSADPDTKTLLTDAVEPDPVIATSTTEPDAPVTAHSETGTINKKQKTGTDTKQEPVTGAVDEIVVAIGEAPDPNTRAVAEHFFDWIRYRLRTNQLYVNRPNARVHRIEQGVALVSPAILQDFCQSMKYPKMTNDKETWKVVQKHLHKMNKHIKTKRQNLQKIIIKNERSQQQSTLNVYLFETDFFYPDIKAPEINTKVILITV
jgi:integrating conjugative element relaxase (TIGR03760 family)